MSSITLQLPDELASRLRGQEHLLPQILEIGLRHINANRQTGFREASEILEILASLPGPEQVLALRPSPNLAERIGELLAKGRETGLTDEERQEWDRFEYLEHIVRLAKSSATRRLQSSSGDARD